MFSRPLGIEGHISVHRFFLIPLFPAGGRSIPPLKGAAGFFRCFSGELLVFLDQNTLWLCAVFGIQDDKIILLAANDNAVIFRGTGECQCTAGKVQPIVFGEPKRVFPCRNHHRNLAAADGYGLCGYSLLLTGDAQFSALHRHTGLRRMNSLLLAGDLQFPAGDCNSCALRILSVLPDISILPLEAQAPIMVESIVILLSSMEISAPDQMGALFGQLAVMVVSVIVIPSSP